MAFTGVGDAAIRVKMEQDQRRQQAEQFDKTFGEGQRRFDIGVQADAEKEAEQRRQQAEQRRQQAEQFDKTFGEGQRRFDIGVQADAEKEAEQRRQFDVKASLDERNTNVSEFRALLDQRMQEADLEGKDADTKLRIAKLREFMIATEEEEKRRKNREKMAKSAFGSVFLAGLMNGGTIPMSAIELFNKEVGDKDHRAVGGVIEPNSGIGVLDIRGPDGKVTQLKMSPENQYITTQVELGDDAANIFLEKYKSNAQVTAALQRAQLKMQGDVEKARISTTAKMQADAAKRNDPLRMAESLEKVAEARRRQIENLRITDPGAADKMTAEVARIENQASQLRESALPESMRAKTFTVTPEMIKKYKIEPGYRVATDPATGLNTVVWVKDGKRYSQSFKSGK